MSAVTVLTVKNGDLSGKYFTDSGYAFTTVTPSNFLVTATGYTNDALNLTVTLDQLGNWGGTLIQ